MQIKSFIAVAALALTVQADKEITVGKGGALDFSKSGGVAIAARGLTEANQAAHGPVAMGGAMDFSKSSRKQNKRASPYEAKPSTTCTEEDLPWIPEWTAGASVVGEEQEKPSTPAAATPTSSVLQKGQVVSTSSSTCTESTAATASSSVSQKGQVMTTSSSSIVTTTSSVAALTTSLALNSSHVSSSTFLSLSRSSIISVSSLAHNTSTSKVVSSLSSSPLSTSSVVVPSTTHSSVSSHVTTSSVASPSISSTSSIASTSVPSTSFRPSATSTDIPKAAPTSTHTTSSTSALTTSKATTSTAISTSTPAPPTTTAPPSPVGPATHGPVTFKIINSMGGSITISYQLGTYSPATGGPTTVASSLIGPSATTGVFATETTVVAPVGWAGRMTIGKAGGPLDYRGTKIEGNNGFDGADPNADPDPDVDISYVDGYSVPTTCSCGSQVLSGCNKELFDLGNKCDNLVGEGEHRVCVNDPRDIHGPANAFFAPCKAAAYTYDYDDVANWQGSCPGNTITCCIGTSCPFPDRQPKAKNKREMMAVMGAKKRSEALNEA